jgi:hypothetical protein
LVINLQKPAVLLWLVAVIKRPAQGRLLGMSRLLIKGSLLGGSLVAGYYGYQHWKNIQIYPAEARSELRSALRAMHNGKSGDAEKKFHNALDICVKTHGESSV